MGKVAEYLQQHIWGEVSARPQILDELSRDGSALTIKPELAVYPQTTNDIRKTARFAWQLAEKGHVLPLVIRGEGTDTTGAAIGRGISIITTRHLNHVYEFDVKQRLIRVQPGVQLRALRDVLQMQGMGLPGVISRRATGTIGGAISNDARTASTGTYSSVIQSIDKLEVVLANGDVIQTGRISKRELNHRKGEQGFEGDIYRGIDALIEDNSETIDQIAARPVGSVGYSGIAEVKQKDGSFDLSPLFVGAQGTLGVIAEMIVKAEFVPAGRNLSVLCFATAEQARDAIEQIEKLQPTTLEYYDAALFDEAVSRGNYYDFYHAATKAHAVEAVITVSFDDFSARAQAGSLKKLAKLAGKMDDVSFVQAEGDDLAALSELQQVRDIYSAPENKETSAPALLDGLYVPRAHMEQFVAGVADIALKLKVALPLYGWPLQNLYNLSVQLQLGKTGDRQKALKLIDEIEKLVVACDGSIVGMGGEGRLKAKFAWRSLSETEIALYESIRKIFDPYNMLAPGVKQPGDLRTIAEALRTDVTPRLG